MAILCYSDYELYLPKGMSERRCCHGKSPKGEIELYALITDSELMCLHKEMVYGVMGFCVEV